MGPMVTIYEIEFIENIEITDTVSEDVRRKCLVLDHDRRTTAQIAKDAEDELNKEVIGVVRLMDHFLLEGV